MDTIFVKAVEVDNVFDPESKIEVTKKGAEVPRSLFWLRRLQDGSVALVDNEKPAKANKKED